MTFNPPGHGTSRHLAPILHRSGTAFTLIELLVVIAIIGTLAGILLPVFGSARNSADKATCIARLKQITAATNLAANDNNGNYPDMRSFAGEPPYDDTQNYTTYVLAPYVAGQVGQDPTKLLRCPAAEKNRSAKGAGLLPSSICQYRFNAYEGQNHKPLVGYTNAMLFFDATWPDWSSTDLAHSPGGAGYMNVAYADGHVTSLPYQDYKALNSAGDSAESDFFKLGWLK